jgi:hypothetical protein
MTKRLNIVFDDQLHLYKINGEHVASVTQILGNTVPKQLQYWGYRLGLKAAEHLLKTRSWPALQAMDWQELEAEVRTLERSDQELHLSPNRARDDRGDEGAAVHRAIEHYHKTGEIPAFSDYDPELRGFIAAFSKFVLEQDVEIEEVEPIVAHGDEGYAGRPDLIARFAERGRGLVDFKTSRRVKYLKRGVEPIFEVYESFHAQLRLYEEAYVWTETFHGDKTDKEVRPDFRAICFLHENGDYALIPGTQAAWAMRLPSLWYSMRDDGMFKAPWETDPTKRRNGLKRTGAPTPK